MLWFTLRLHRTEILLFTAITVVLLAFLIPFGIMEHQEIVTSGMQHCVNGGQVKGGQPSPDTCYCVYGGQPGSDSCYIVQSNFESSIYAQIQSYFSWLVVLPLLFGIFLGVPVVARQYEHGSYRFLFTQGVSRTRWLLFSCGILGIIVLALTGAIVAVTSWWNAPFEAFNTPYEQTLWDSEHVIPFVLGIFGLIVGVTSGAVTRRILPGVGLAAVYLPTWIVFDRVARGFLFPWNRVVLNMPTPSATDTTGLPHVIAGDWIVRDGVLDHSGHEITDAVISATCSSSGSAANPQQVQQAQQAYADCVHAHGFKYYMLWQPISHYWDIQLVEAGIFAVLTALLIWGSVALVRKRRG